MNRTVKFAIADTNKNTKKVSQVYILSKEYDALT